jgi:hypothetical protein
MDGVWIAPVTAQVMMTLFALAKLRSPDFLDVHFSADVHFSRSDVKHRRATHLFRSGIGEPSPAGTLARLRVDFIPS